MNLVRVPGADGVCIDQSGSNSTFRARASGCRVTNSATQAIPNSAETAINFDGEEYDSDGYHFTSAANLTGTVSKTSGSAAITGSSTLFTSELSVGQVISIPGGGGTDKCVVKTVVSNTSLTVWSQTQPANTASGQTAARVNSAIAVPAGFGGEFDLIAWVEFFNNGTGLRYIVFHKNGSANPLSVFMQGNNGASFGNYMPDGTILKLDDGDFVEVYAWQTSGGSLNINNTCNMVLSRRGSLS